MSRIVWALPLLLVFCVSTQAAPAYVNSCTTSGSGSCIMTASTNDLVIATFISCGNSTTIPVSDSISSTYTVVNSINTIVTNTCAIGRNVQLTEYIAKIATGGTITFTFAGTGNQIFAATIFALYSGTVTPIAQDPNGGAQSLCNVAPCGPSVTTPNITTTVSTDLLVSVIGTNGTVVSAGSGYTLRNSKSFTSGGTWTVYIEDKNSGAPGTYAGTWTLSNSNSAWGALVNSYGNAIVGTQKHKVQIM